MPDSAEYPDSDFDTQLRGLFHEAEQNLQGRAAAAAAPEAETEKDAARKVDERVLKSYQSLPQMLRPMVLGLEAVSRATGENSAVLQRLDKAATETSAAQNSWTALVAGLENLLEQKNSVSQRMFDALHEELKGYKDGFLLESVLKPIIRDLISLYDDLSTILGQMRESVREVAKAGSDAVVGILLQRLKTMEMNIEHHCEFVLEILARLEVRMMPVGSGRLDMLQQRAVAVEMAEDPEEDMTIVRMVKRGFIWKERVLRAEEVVIRKWKEGFLVALSVQDSQK
jgi:molecular chaperone GrpE (heat shock protein)